MEELPKIMLLFPGRTFTQGFSQSLANLVRDLVIKGYPYGLRWDYSSDLYMLRNNLIGSGPDNGGASVIHPAIKDADYVVWIDSDMVFSPEDVFRLVSHGEDVVSGFAAIDMDRTACGVFGTDPPSMGYHSVGGLDELETNDRGLVEIDFAGMAFIAMRPKVFEDLDFPWFRTYSFELGGAMINCSEDTGFCQRIKGAGYRIWADPSIRIGHEKIMRLKV